jgi:hypothetical protein
MERRKSSKHKTAQLFKRYVWLVDVLGFDKRLTFKEINDLWLRSDINEEKEDFPIRTFHNHREAIGDMFEVVISCDRHDDNKYYIENADFYPQKIVRDMLLSAYTLNILITENQKLKNRILFEEIPSGQQFLKPVIEAMRDERMLEIKYQSFKSDEPRNFEIEPYCVKLFKQRWYLLAKSLKFNALRIYALDRIQNLKTMKKPFQLPKDFQADAYFAHAFGITVDEKIAPCKIQLKAFGHQQKYLQTLPLHHSQEETETTDTYSIFTYFLAPTYEFKQELLSICDKIEVLSPASLRQEMKETFQQVNTIYAS